MSITPSAIHIFAFLLKCYEEYDEQVLMIDFLPLLMTVLANASSLTLSSSFSFPLPFSEAQTTLTERLTD